MKVFKWMGPTFIYISDRMAEIMKKELDVNDFEMTSTVEDTCFVNIPENEIKMENIEVKGKLNFKYYLLTNEQMARPTKKKNELSESSN